ncbi:MAG TPA: prepilin peptidase [Gemmataceae bacterium]|nr:prepilin peptidase [Gemmataceae bacterium]
MILYVWLVPLLLWLFLLGAAVGSFLNVCIYRIPLGKSLTWPGSRCGRCFHEVRLKDNIPLVSYWALRGRCRDCGAAFSMQYFWIELLTAVTFVALYLLEIGLNVQHLTVWPHGGFTYLEWGRIPDYSWGLFIFHAALACFLITATGCLLDRGRVPPAVVITGTLAGLAGAVLFPWPFPHQPAEALIVPSARRQPYLPEVDGGTPAHPRRGPMPPDESWSRVEVSPRPGFYAWPVWGPWPAAWWPRQWPLGLLTGLAGALFGGWGLRLVALVARGFPPGGADLAMISGAFLGWQPLLVAVVLAFAVAALVYPLRRRPPPFGLCLALGIVVAWLGWAWIGPAVRPILFSPTLLPLLLAAGLGLVGVLARLVRPRAAKLSAPVPPVA